jgi:hypothetical protein
MNNMKNINVIKYVLSAILLVTGAGCSDVLNKKDLTAITDGDVWNDPLYAKAYLDKLVRDNLPGWDYGVAAKSDEGDCTRGDGQSQGIMWGELTVTSVDTWNYTSIRNINLFLEGVVSGNISPSDQELFAAQALVLRAWRYFEMVRLYGGMPMVMHAQKLTEDLYTPRSKTSESIRLIIKDLDDAIATPSLPWSWSGNDAGRISKAAALALKGRILLYYASPQFNPNNDKSRWEEAYAVNRQATEELASQGYGLFEVFENLYYPESNEMHREAIMVKRYQEPGYTNNWQAVTRPLTESQNGSRFTYPTWELAEAFPMVDGTPIAEAPGYDPVRYWTNRDPRFYSTIAYNSCLWELSGKSGRRQWTYGGAEENLPTMTGFYCRKAINPAYTSYYTEYGSTDWIEIRYAEVMMNYAECAVETGRIDEAYQILKQIRARAGITAGSNDLYGLKASMNQSEMVRAIIHERRIEFAFEGKRYWDLRRRRLFSELNGKKRHGISPTLLISQDEFNRIQGTIDFDKDYATYFLDEIVPADRTNDINFRDNYYFYAIPTGRLETNSKLEQTKGWDNGTFDPLE